MLLRMNSLLCGYRNLHHIETLRTGQCGNLETMAFQAVLPNLSVERKLSIQFEYDDSDVHILISVLRKFRGIESLRVRVESREGNRHMQRCLSDAVRRHKEMLREIMIEEHPSFPCLLFGHELLETIRTCENVRRLALAEEYFKPPRHFRNFIVSMPSLVALRIQKRDGKEPFIGFGAHGLVHTIPATSPFPYFRYAISALRTRCTIGFVSRGQELWRINWFRPYKLLTSYEEFGNSTGREVDDEDAEYIFFIFWR